MKTINTITGAVLMLLSLNTFAGDSDLKFTEDHPKYVVAKAPLVWGKPDEIVPLELKFVKAKYAKVPLAPFVWAKSLDQAEINSFRNLKVPVAPLVLGSADDQEVEISGLRKSTDSKVAVAPFVWGKGESEDYILNLHNVE